MLLLHCCNFLNIQFSCFLSDQIALNYLVNVLMLCREEGKKVVSDKHPLLAVPNDEETVIIITSRDEVAHFR